MAAVTSKQTDPRLGIPETASLLWIVLATVVLLRSSQEWVPKQIYPLSFLGRAVGLLAAGAALMLLYFIIIERLEALLWRDWRYFVWGLALLAYFLLIELVDSVFVLPHYVHILELLTILFSVALSAWALTSIMSRLATIVSPRRQIPWIRPSWVLLSWLAVLLAVTLRELPKIEPLPQPRYQDLVLDLAIIAVLLVIIARLAGRWGRVRSAGKWLMEASLTAMGLGVVAESYVMLEDVVQTSKTLNVLGYTITGLIAFAVALSGFGYYALGTTPYRERAPPEEREKPSLDWEEFGLSLRPEGEVILVEFDPLSSPPELISSLASWLREAGCKIVVLARRGTPLRDVISESDLAIQVSSSRAAAPKELAPGEFEVGLDPSVILGIISRIFSPDQKMALIVENVSDMSTLMGLESTYRLVRAMIDMLVPEGSIVTLAVNPGAHEIREINLLRGLATWIVDATKYPPFVKKIV